MTRKRKPVASRSTNKPSLLDELRTDPTRKLTAADRQRLVDELRADPAWAAATMAGEWRDAVMAVEARKVAAREAAAREAATGRCPRRSAVARRCAIGSRSLRRFVGISPAMARGRSWDAMPLPTRCSFGANNSCTPSHQPVS